MNMPRALGVLIAVALIPLGGYFASLGHLTGESTLIESPSATIPAMSADQVIYFIGGLTRHSSDGTTIRESLAKMCAAFAKTPFPQKCGWTAKQVSSRWRVTSYQKGLNIDDKPTSVDFIWLLDPSTMQVQPRNANALLFFMNESDFKNPRNANEAVDALAQYACGNRSCLDGKEMNTELEDLPWFQTTNESGQEVATPDGL